MAQFTFDSVDEIRSFVKDHLKGPKRGGRDEAEQETVQAPAPIMPPQSVHTNFAPPPNGYGSGTPAFPATFAAAPEVIALVQRINAKIDGAVASGQPQDTVLGWFRQRCGSEAAAATLDQIKSVFLPKLSIPNLEETAKLMGA